MGCWSALNPQVKMSQKNNNIYIVIFLYFIFLLDYLMSCCYVVGPITLTQKVKNFCKKILKLVMGHQTYDSYIYKHKYMHDIIIVIFLS
jgi:hypothetical protein